MGVAIQRDQKLGPAPQSKQKGRLKMQGNVVWRALRFTILRELFFKAEYIA